MGIDPAGNEETLSVATTVLAVDDSVTMRKVLEITFAGSDFHVVTAASGEAALQAVAQHQPAIAIVDATLPPSDGYDVCKQLKAAAPSMPVVILSSKQNPYNAAAGSAAGADDHIDKPYDTQQVVDRIGKIVAGGGGARPTAASPTATPAPAARPAAPAPAAPAAAARGKTLLYSAEQVPPVVQQARAASPAPVAAPAARPAAPAVTAAAGPALGAAVTGHIQQRLQGADLNLSPQQVDAIAALSRDVVERIVWEVVPVLAETIIKEEIARLTK